MKKEVYRKEKGPVCCLLYPVYYVIATRKARLPDLIVLSISFSEFSGKLGLIFNGEVIK
jgi:hypothetical protein